MYKISSQVIDYYDDKTLLLDLMGVEIPDILKTAEMLAYDEASKMQDEYYAVIMMTKTGGLLRKYPTFDKEHTYLSCLAFEKTAHRLPVEAVKTAASNLYSMCLYHNIDCPATIKKLASDITTNIVRIDESKDLPLEFYMQEEVNKVASANVDDTEYGLVTESGHKMYPLNTRANVSAAINYFEKKAYTMLPQYRDQLAKNICKFASSYDLEVPATISMYNSEKGDNILFNLRARMPLTKTAEEKECLSTIMKLSGSLDKNTLIKYIDEFDKTAGLNKYWDRHIKNPYTTVLEKVAVEDEKLNDDEINEQDIMDYSQGFAGQDLPGHLPDEIVNKFIGDPIGTFHNMPEIQQELILRGIKGSL